MFLCISTKLPTAPVSSSASFAYTTVTRRWGGNIEVFQNVLGNMRRSPGAMGRDEAGRDGLSESRRITLRTLFPSVTSTITLKRSNYFLLSTHKFQYCSARLSLLLPPFFPTLIFSFFVGVWEGLGILEIEAERD